MLNSPAWIGAAVVACSLLAGFLLGRDIQLGIVMTVGLLFLSVALVSLPLAIAAWVPLVYMQAWPAASLIPSAVGIILLLAWFGSLTPQGHASKVIRRHRPAFLALLLFLTWVTLSVLWATDASLAAEDLWIWYMAGTAFMVIATTLSTERHLVVISLGFVAAAVLSIAIAAPQLGSAAGEEARLGGEFANPNYLAAGLLSAAVLSAGLLVYLRGTAQRTLLVVALIAIAAGLLATGSRGGFVATAVATIAAFWIMRGRRLHMGALIALTVVVGAVWLGASSGSGVERIWRSDTGSSGRVDLWSVATRMFADHPVIGVGYGQFPVESVRYVFLPGQLQNVDLIVETPKEVHNAYLAFLAELGVIGLLLFVVVVMMMLRITWQAAAGLEKCGEHRLALLGRAVLVAQIGALAALTFAENPFNLPLWILLALGPVLMSISISGPDAEIETDVEEPLPTG